MNLGLDNKVALVAGGSRGCGLGIAVELAKEGASVALSGRNEDVVRIAVECIRRAGGKATGVVADMVDQAGAKHIVAETCKAFGSPDILIVNPPGPTARSRGFENTPYEEFREANEKWIMSLVYLAREVIPAMKAKQWGRIVDIASIGVKTPHLEDPMYTSNTRVGVVGVIKTLAHEYGRYNITANAIATGPFLTELSRDYMTDTGALTEEQMLAATALGRWGRPDEMGAVVAFLCSERASYVSGETIRVDGGYSPSLF